MKEFVRVNFTSSPETHYKIRLLAAKKGVSIRAIILNALANSYEELKECIHEKEKNLS